MHRKSFSLNISFAFFVSLFFIGSARSQYIVKGTVTDQDTNPLPFATIKIASADTLLIGTEYSDSLGKFIIKNVSVNHYLFIVSHVGYASRFLALNVHSDTDLTIALQPSGKELKEISVTKKQHLLERKGGKVVYNVENSVTAEGSDGLEALRKVPGVKINDDNVSLAGRGTVRVMVDERLLQLSGNDLLNYLRSLSSNDITKIEVISNPAARYDAEGNAGLINIVTKRNKKLGYSGGVQASLKQAYYGIATAGANIAYNSGKWSLYGNLNFGKGRFLEGFGIDEYYPDHTWKQTDTGNYTVHNIDLLLGADYKLSDKTTVGFIYTGGELTYKGSDHVLNPVYAKDGQLDSTLRSYAVYHPVSLPNGINLHIVTNLDTTGKKVSLDADYFNFYRTDESNFETNSFDREGKLTPWGNSRIYDNNKQAISVYTLKMDVELPSKIARFMLGGKIAFIDNYSNAFYFNKTNTSTVFDSALSNEFKYNENTQALYVSAAKEKEKWSLQAGLRGEFTQTKGFSYTILQTDINHYFKLFPSLSATYKANGNNTYSASFNKRINRPTFWNLNPFKSLTTAYSYLEGNPYLRPENATNAELVHTYKDMITTTLYVNFVDNGYTNVTIPKTDTDFVYTKPLNFISGSQYGLSESITLTPLKWLESENQLNAYYSSSRSNINFIKSIKNFGFFLSTSNTISFNKEKTVTGAVNFWCHFPGVEKIGLSDTYCQLDLGVNLLLFKKKLTVGLNGNDLFRSSGSSIFTTVNNIRQTFRNFQVNRSVLLSFSYKFGNKTVTANDRKTGNEEEKSRTN